MKTSWYFAYCNICPVVAQKNKGADHDILFANVLLLLFSRRPYPIALHHLHYHSIFLVFSPPRTPQSVRSATSAYRYQPPAQEYSSLACRCGPIDDRPGPFNFNRARRRAFVPWHLWLEWLSRSPAPRRWWRPAASRGAMKNQSLYSLLRFPKGIIRKSYKMKWTKYKYIITSVMKIRILNRQQLAVKTKCKPKLMKIKIVPV
jgi:hypothetical protein